jgi:hypothetical protein
MVILLNAVHITFANTVPCNEFSIRYDDHQEVWATINRTEQITPRIITILSCLRRSVENLIEQRIAEIIASMIGRISKK